TCSFPLTAEQASCTAGPTSTDCSPQSSRGSPGNRALLSCSRPIRNDRRGKRLLRSTQSSRHRVQPRGHLALTVLPKCRGLIGSSPQTNHDNQIEQSIDGSNKMPSSHGSIARMLVLSVTLTCPFAIYGSSDQGYFFGTTDAGANKATD